MYSNSYVWAKIIRYLEEHLTAATTAGYFDDIEVIELTEEQLIIHTPTAFRRDIIRRRFAAFIQDALKEIFHSDAKVLVFSDEDLDAYRSKGGKSSAMDFNPQFSFENFVVGPSNRFAHGAAVAVSNTPGQV